LSAGWNERMNRSWCGRSMSGCSVAEQLARTIHEDFYSRRLLLQLPIHRCDKSNGGRARCFTPATRSVVVEEIVVLVLVV
jgi:hypothetical protein